MTYSGSLEDFNLYDEDTVNRFCLVFFDEKQPDEQLQGILDEVVEKVVGSRERGARGISFFCPGLHPALRIHLAVGYVHRCRVGKAVRFQPQSKQEVAETGIRRCERCVSDSVDLDSFRVNKIHSNLYLRLKEGDSEVPGFGGDDSSKKEPEHDLLSNIIKALNDAHQTDFTEADKVDIETIRQKVHADRVTPAGDKRRQYGN